MKEFGQETGPRTAVVPVPSPNAGATRDPLAASDRRTWLVAIPLALIVLYAFIPILDNGFALRCDDDKNFLDNPYFRGLGAAQAKWAWSTFPVGVYQPMAWMLFEVQYSFCQLNPRGYHLTSLVLHVVNGVVLYILTVALLVRCRADSCLDSPWLCCLSAGLATVLFAVHPLRVDAVASASCQPYLPCALFTMLSVLAYLRAFRTSSSPRWGWLAGSFLLFVTALLFKAVAVSLPVVLVILDVYPLRRFPDGAGRWFGTSARRALLEKVPFVIASLLFMATLSLSAGLFLFRQRRPGLLAAWLSYLVMLAPNSGIVPSNTLMFVAHRYSYIAMLGSVTLAAACFCWLWRMSSWWRRDAAIGTIAIGLGSLLALTALTRNQCRSWRDMEALWTHALIHGGTPERHTPFLCYVHNNLGTVLTTQGKYDEALPHFREALRLNPGYADAHNNLGAVLYIQGKYEAAAVHFTVVIRLDPGNVQAHYNLGRVLSQFGNYEAARAQFAEAMRLQPGDPNAYNASAMIMAACPDAKFRDGKRAVQLATRACEITEWKNPTILDTFAAAQAEAGYYDTAVKWQKRAIGLLTDERQKDDYRSRLVIYQARKPYRQLSRKLAPIEARP